MDITRFALGIRFAALAEQPHKEFARKIFEGIFSVLTLTELCDLTLYGGPDPFTSSSEYDKESDVYLVVLMGGKLKQMRKVYRAIAEDAALDMYMMHDRPFVENNRLYKVEGLSYFGQVKPSGRIEGGDGTLDGLTVPKKRGRRKPVGKGIKVLLAPADYESLSSIEAIKRLTVAARRHFQGIKLAPFPINEGGAGFVRSTVTAFGGAVRKTSVASCTCVGKKDACYGVINGRTAVLETDEAFTPGGISSLGVGEMLRRALDEGLKRVIIGMDDAYLGDCGMGVARALGVRFFDEGGNELACSSTTLPLIARAETEYLHPRLSETEILIIDATAHNDIVPPNGEDKLISALNASLSTNENELSGFARTMCALTGAKYSRDYGDLLTAIGFNKLAKNTALLVTGCSVLNKETMRQCKPMHAIIKRCAELKIPVAAVVNSVDDGLSDLYDITNAGIMTVTPSEDAAAQDYAKCFDDAADRMFRFIRMGRDVEKIGAPHQKKVRPWHMMMIESWKK